MGLPFLIMPGPLVETGATVVLVWAVATRSVVGLAIGAGVGVGEGDAIGSAEGEGIEAASGSALTIGIGCICAVCWVW